MLSESHSEKYIGGNPLIVLLFYVSAFTFIFFATLVLIFLLTSSNDITKVVFSSSSLFNFNFVKRIPQEGTSEIQIFQPEGVVTDFEGNV
jgi:hypothetical protein